MSKRKNSFCLLGKAITETEFKIAQERTSFCTTARRPSGRRAALILRRKINGRLCEPPTNWLQKSRSVLWWCGFTTTLETILAKIPEKIHSPRPVAVPLGCTASQKNCLSFKKRRGQKQKMIRQFFCSAPRTIARGGGASLRRRQKEKGVWGK